MEWSKEKVLRFLELYQTYPCIWDPKNKHYKVKSRVTEAWLEIKNNMDDIYAVSELKKKKESLMSMYRGYKTKVMKSQLAGAADVYKPTWFAYEIMDCFLANIYKCSILENNHNAETDETITGYESETSFRDDASAIEEESFASQNFPSSHQTTASNKRTDPLELQQAKRHIGQTFNFVEPQLQYKEEDECTIFGKLVAVKMRKLKGERRDLMMIKINQLFYDENWKNNEGNPLDNDCSSVVYSHPSNNVQVTRMKQDIN